MDATLLKIDYQEQLSDARHEPVPIKLDKLDNIHNIPQLTPPAISEPISITPPPLADDVPMTHQSNPVTPVDAVDDDVAMNPPHQPSSTATNGHTNGLSNGIHKDEPSVSPDIPIDNNSHATTPVDTPLDDSSLPAASSSTAIDSFPASNSYRSPHPVNDDDDDDTKPPPAKRARKNSDPDKASLERAHSATPPPESANSLYTNGATPVSPTPNQVQPTLSGPQHRFCLSTIRSLKKLKDGGPFLHPVDPVALNIPHYPSVIKHPMDLSTVERKLQSSNPVKLDPNPANPRYLNTDEFIADVRLIFQNCLTFNGPDHVVTAMSKRLEEVFDKQVKNMPAPLEPKPTTIKKPSPPPPPPPPPPPAAKKPVPAARRSSTSVPVIRRSDTESIGRPKREIHPPPPKDLPYADVPKKIRKVRTMKDDGTAEQLKFCSKLLQDIHKKQHWQVANPFYEPVDWVKLEIPSYPKVVKKPMDLSTMRRRLDNKEYSSAQKFYDDFKLMIRNCFLFNPAGTPVNQAGIELQRLFDEKWRSLPLLHDGSDEEEEEEGNESDEDRARAIADMENQIETMRGSIAALKSKPVKKEKKEKKSKYSSGNPPASTSKASARQSKASTGPKRKTKKPVADNDVLTFEQKKDLSEAIQNLDGQKLERVIQIIHEGVPEIRDSTEEIELEIDQLPAMVLTKLYNFVLRPLRQSGQGTKRAKSGKGTGTGGLKRKSMDEDVEAEKIRQLEERMKMFDEPLNGNTAATGASASARSGVAHADDSDRSSESSSEDSSGSESE